MIKFFGCSLNIPNAERLFILGILHNLGELVVKQLAAEKITECKDKSNVSLPWDSQREVLGFTYGECGAELLKLWQLPYNLVSPIRNQDEEDFALTNTESQLLFISKRIVAHQKLLKSKEQDELVDELHLSTLGIKDDMLKMAVDYCDMERLSILSVLCPASVTIY